MFKDTNGVYNLDAADVITKNANGTARLHFGVSVFDTATPYDAVIGEVETTEVTPPKTAKDTPAA